MPEINGPPQPGEQDYPTVTLTGFCQLLLSRMAEATMTGQTSDFNDLSLGLVRLISGWAYEKGVATTIIYEAVDKGVADCLQRHGGMVVRIPVNARDC